MGTPSLSHWYRTVPVPAATTRNVTLPPGFRQALEAYYLHGPATDWPSRFVSAYASAHPWEDWAETWAHYLHMIDTVDTAAACGLSLVPPRTDEPMLDRLPHGLRPRDVPFDRLINSWFPLTYVVNSLNRGLGVADPYPFVLSQGAVEKLHYVHDLIASVTAR